MNLERTPWPVVGGHVGHRGSLTRRGLLRLGAAGAGALAVGGCANFERGGGDGPQDYRFTYWGLGEEKEQVARAVDRLSAARGLTGRPISVSGDYETKLNTMVAASIQPDAGYLTESMAMRLGEAGIVANVLGRAQYEDYLPSAIHHYAEDGAVAQTCVEGFGMFYDAAAARAAGVRVPAEAASAWAYDDLVQAADALTVDGSGRHPSEAGFDVTTVQRFGIAAPTNLTPILALLASNGVELFDDAGTRTGIADPPALQVLQDVADLIHVHRVSPTPAQTLSYGATTALLLASGRVSIVIDGAWALINLGTSGIDYDVGVLPSYQEYRTTVTAGASGLFTASTHEEAGWELLAGMADPSQVDLYKSGLWMPLQRQYYTDESLIASWVTQGIHPPGFRTAVMQPTLESPVVYPSYKLRNWTLVQTTLQNGLGALFVEGGTDIRARASALAARVDGLLQGAYPDSAS